MQQVAVRRVDLETVEAEAGGARAVAAKSARIFFRPAASRATGGSSCGECGRAEGATARQLPGWPSETWAPPSQGARLDALRPACASCMPNLIGELARTAPSTRASAASLSSL